MSAERDHKYGSDPEALAWAREKVDKALSRVEDMAFHVARKGEPDRAEGYSGAAWRVRSMLIGGEGCSVGAFDERRAEFYATRCIHDRLLDDVSHRCGVPDEGV